MKTAKLALAALALALPGAALAQAADLAVGATVRGPQGNVVGTVKELAGENVVLDTGKHVATLPGSAFGTSEAGPTFSMTKTDLDAAIEASLAQQAAALDAALVPGAALTTSDGVAVGTIASIDEEGLVEVDRDGSNFRLGKDMFAPAEGGVALKITEAQLMQALGTAAS